MNRYLPLEEVFKRNTGTERFLENESEGKHRLNDASAFRTGIEISSGELFFTIPNELSRLSEKVLRVERKISSLWKSLPPIARGASIRSLVMDEIVSSNKIEGIRSTRKQIATALTSLNEETAIGEQRKAKKFREFALLYINLTEKTQSLPKTPQDIRIIYDAVVSGSLKKRDQPDGIIFRTETVDVQNRFGYSVHKGVYPEESIVQMINKMLDLVASEEIPEMYSAILSHFVFEYIHPFYDGNGRTGRYLLALYLSKPLSMPTVLSLSRVIAENSKPYYKAFSITESKLNHAEATFFILEMMKLIRIAQEELLSDLEQKIALLASAEEHIFGVRGTPTDLSEKANQLLYLFAQDSLFALLSGVAPNEGARYLGVTPQTARKYAQELFENGLVYKTSNRPLAFALSQKGSTLLELPT